MVVNWLTPLCLTNSLGPISDISVHVSFKLTTIANIFIRMKNVIWLALG